MGSRASPTIVSISHCTPVAHTGTSTTRKNQRENPLAAMTASTIPPHEQSDNSGNTDNTESRAHTPPDWWDHHRPIASDEYSDMALMLGALSILTFWMFGLGILLCAAAIGTALAARRPDTPDTIRGTAAPVSSKSSPALPESPSASSSSPQHYPTCRQTEFCTSGIELVLVAGSHKI